MNPAGAATLTAVMLPARRAAAAIRAAWDSGEAVAPLDPNAPAEDTRRVLASLRPTHLLDADGCHEVDGGLGVAPEVAAVVHTSGTTTDPRGVELTWEGLRASASAVSSALDAGDGDAWLCCLPLHHVAGLSIVARSWVTGSALVVIARFDPAEIAGTRATLVSLVPTTLGRALDAGADLSRFRRVLVGGAAMPEDLKRRAATAGVRLVTTYGLTETWGGVAHDGMPLAGVGLRVAAGGEIQVRGPMLMRGYRLRPEETVAAFAPEGWLRTGDAGAMDADGRLCVVDRLSDIVITGGVNVSPSEVEAVLALHPAVADVCVGGAPDPEWGERVVAHVVLALDSAPPTLAGLRAFAADRLAPAKLPREVVLVDHIPRTPSGKPLRRLRR